MQVRRGDIVIVELNPTTGSEQQGKSRPCVIIQNDVGIDLLPRLKTRESHHGISGRV